MQLQVLDVQFQDSFDIYSHSHIHLFGVSSQGQSVCIEVPFGSEMYIQLPPQKPRENWAALVDRVKWEGEFSSNPIFVSRWASRPYTVSKMRLVKLTFKSVRAMIKFVKAIGKYCSTWPLSANVPVVVFEDNRSISAVERFCSSRLNPVARIECKTIDLYAPRYKGAPPTTTTRQVYSTTLDKIAHMDDAIAESSGLRHLSLAYSIETSSSRPILPDKAHRNTPPHVLMISYVVVDNRLGQADVHMGVLTWKPLSSSSRVPELDHVNIECFATERAMLDRFDRLIKVDYDADVIICHDGYGFALDYLANRARTLGNSCMMNMGRYTRGHPQNVRPMILDREARFMASPGRIQFDTLFIAKSRKEKQFDLDFLSRGVIPSRECGYFMGNVDCSRTWTNSIDRTCNDHCGAWAMFSSGQVDQLAKSCLHQSVLTHLIFDEWGVMNSAAAQSRISLIPIQASVLKGRNAQLMPLILSAMREAKVVLSVPNETELEPHYNVWMSKVDYEGGKNLETKCAILSEPVVMLDFSRMFPSIQQLKNICPSTVTCSDWLSARDRKIITDEKIPIETITIRASDRKSSQEVVICQDPNRGFVPVAQKRLWGLRTLYKRLQSECDPADKHRIAMYRACEIEAKTAANSLYGLLNSPSCKISNGFAAASIAHFGRMALENIEPLAKERDKDIQVIYGDTDSAILWKPSSCYTDEDKANEESMRRHMEQVAMDVGQYCSTKITQSLLGGRPCPENVAMVLDLDKCMHPFALYDKKKNYVGIVQPRDKFVALGSTIVARNTAPHLRRELARLAEYMVRNAPVDIKSTAKWCLEQAQQLCLDVARGNVPINDLARMKDIKNKRKPTTSASLTATASTNEAVRVAAKRRDRGDFKDTGIGSRIPFVNVLSLDKAEDPAYAAANESECPLDLEFYALKHYGKSLARQLAPLASFGVTEDQITIRARQVFNKAASTHTKSSLESSSERNAKRRKF